MPQSRQLAAIMFTDIVGYTALMGDDEQIGFEFLRQKQAITKTTRRKIQRHMDKKIRRPA